MNYGLRKNEEIELDDYKELVRDELKRLKNKLDSAIEDLENVLIAWEPGDGLEVDIEQLEDEVDDLICAMTDRLGL